MMFSLIRLVSRKTIYITFAIQLLHKLAFLSVPIIEMKLIDALTEKGHAGLSMYVTLSVLFFFLCQGLNYAVDLAEGYAAKEAWVSIYVRLDQELCDLDVKHSNVTSANLQQFMGQNYELIKRFIFQAPLLVVINSLYIIGIIVCMLSLSIPITLVVALSIPIFLVLSMRFEKRMTANTKRNIQDMEKLKDYESDQFRLIKEERFLILKQLLPITGLLKTYAENMRKKIKTEAVFDNLLSYGMLNAVILISTLMSAYYVYHGSMTIGSLFAITLYTSRFWDPAEFFATIRKDYLSTKPVIQSFTAFLDLPTVTLPNEPVHSIEIRNYTGIGANGEKLHQVINHRFERGSLHLICGDNGCGKTTLIESILGLSDRYHGEIWVNNAKMEGQMLGNSVYIPAEPFISEYGVLPYRDGSYGQKKLTQIKHDIQTEKSIYFFDEPTNFLDNSNKGVVCDLICNLVEKGKIVVVVSHDPLFLKLANTSVLEIKAAISTAD